jgi:hypothetical protein
VIQSGNATATHGGIAVTGIFSPTVHLPPEAMQTPAEVDAPAGLNNLPHRPGHFIGRSRDLDHFDAAPSTPGMALVQVVHGLGGVGKSTLAAHWAATRPHGCAPVRWITADSPAGVQQGLASDLRVACPDCGHRSARVHSRYSRTLADVAAGGCPVLISLVVRRLFCDSAVCGRRTFAEQVEGLTVRYQRRSTLLQHLVEMAGVLLAGRGGARLLHILKAPLSRTSVLFHLMRIRLPSSSTPRVGRGRLRPVRGRLRHAAGGCRRTTR